MCLPYHTFSFFIWPKLIHLRARKGYIGANLLRCHFSLVSIRNNISLLCVCVCVGGGGRSNVHIEAAVVKWINHSPCKPGIV